MQDVQPVCRSCGEDSLTPILPLGKLAVADHTSNDSRVATQESHGSLDLALCSRCALVQIIGTAPAEELCCSPVQLSVPRENIARRARAMTAQIIASQKLRPTSLVIEIGSGDGQLLEAYQHAGIPVLGIEHSLDLAEVARLEHHVPTLSKRFDRDLGIQLEGCGQPADVVHVHDVLAHVADPGGFAAGLKVLLKETGVAVIETLYVKDLIDHDRMDNAQCDPVQCEQLCYFSLTSAANLLGRNGLAVHDVERVAMHGGSLRLFVGRSASSSGRVRTLLDEEASWGVDRPESYANFGQRLKRLLRTQSVVSNTAARVA